MILFITFSLHQCSKVRDFFLMLMLNKNEGSHFFFKFPVLKSLSWALHADAQLPQTSPCVWHTCSQWTVVDKGTAHKVEGKKVDVFFISPDEWIALLWEESPWDCMSGEGERTCQGNFLDQEVRMGKGTWKKNISEGQFEKRQNRLAQQITVSVQKISPYGRCISQTLIFLIKNVCVQTRGIAFCQEVCFGPWDSSVGSQCPLTPDTCPLLTARGHLRDLPA